MAAFWDTQEFTNDIVHHWNLDNFRKLWEEDATATSRGARSGWPRS